MNAETSLTGLTKAIEWLWALLLAAMVLALALVGYCSYHAIDDMVAAVSEFRSSPPALTSSDPKVIAAYAAAMYSCRESSEPDACVVDAMIANTSGLVQQYFRAQSARVYTERSSGI